MSFTPRLCLIPCLLFTFALTVAPAVSAADPRAGEKLYRQHCARCHGATGEGTKKHREPLAGDKPLAELAKVIDKTMPEDDPDKLDAAQSADVAAFIYDAFYSPSAQARNKPARVELSRLTVTQYRNAVADLIGSFRPAPPRWDDTRGLRGEYYNARRPQDNKRLIVRTDPEVKFDFGTKGPDDRFEPHQFSIRWEGSVLAPETGTYEFVVRTEHATRLWVNDRRTPLIDAWVKSGNETEYRGSVTLLAGRTYQLVLEFSKAKQGVDDSKKKKTNPPPKPASIALLWKPPHGTAEVIPTRFLSLPRPAEVFVVTTPFPPDDRSMGWERGTTVSKEWETAATDAALETAGYVVAKLSELAGVSDTAPDRAAKLREFCRKFAERAFRRPLTGDEIRVFIDRQFEAAADPEAAVKRAVVFVLMSPRFLYREVGDGPEAYNVASRLSFALWDSIPDNELLKAAVAGKLSTREQVAAQAERMLADPRAKAKVRAFLLGWLKVDQPLDLVKDIKRFPRFDPGAAADLRASLEIFLDDVVWGPDSDFRKLLLADYVYLNPRLAQLYGAAVPLPPEPGFQPVRLDPGRRAGVLTHPYLLSAFAYTADSSPIHRGVFVARGILGVTLRPPPDAFTPFPASLHPNLTTRERVALQTKPAACISCHGVINPLGYPLEHFDAIGRYREKENGKPVDATGSYQTRVGTTAKFDGATQLARFLAESPDVHAAFAEKLFHHLVKQPVRAYGPQKLDELRKGFVKDGYSVRKLVVAVAAAGALPPKPQ